MQKMSLPFIKLCLILTKYRNHVDDYRTLSDISKTLKYTVNEVTENIKF